MGHKSTTPAGSGSKQEKEYSMQNVIVEIDLDSIEVLSEIEGGGSSGWG